MTSAVPAKYAPSSSSSLGLCHPESDLAHAQTPFYRSLPRSSLRAGSASKTPKQALHSLPVPARMSGPMPPTPPRPQHASSPFTPPDRLDSADPAMSVMESVSQKHPSNAARVWDYDKLLRLSLAPMVRPERLQLSPAGLKTHFHAANWAVNTHTLDLATGAASSGQCFLRPRAQPDVARMLQTARPWLDPRDPAADFPTTVKNQPCVETRFDNSCGLWACVFRYLEGSGDPDKAGILGSFTRWSDTPNADPGLQYFGKQKAWHWQTLSIITRTSQPGLKMDWEGLVAPRPDTSEPHTMAVVANMAQIVPGEISTAEMTALIYLAEHIVADPNYNHHKILPITIFNMSDRKVRIVQGCFNMEKRILDVNVSRVLDFSTFLTTPERHPDFFQLLGWLTSDPVGETT